MVKLIAGGVCVFLLFILAISGCRTVDSGSIGVAKVWRKISDEPLQPGLHFVNPISTSIVHLDIKLKSYEVSCTAASKDLQGVKTVVSVQHSLNPALAAKSLAAIGDIDAIDANVVSPAVMECSRAVTAQYTAEELITKREIVKNEMSEEIQAFINHTLDTKGILGAVNIANVAIKDFEFSSDFNDSIEAKVKSQQDALKAEIEKRQAITKAEADKAVAELKADGEAYQLEKISISRADAIKREAEALATSPNLVELRKVEKWDGRLPQTMPGQAVPFINVK